MNKQTKRITLRWGVAIATGLAVVVNIVLIVLFEQGKLGRCDGIWIIGNSFIASIALLATALMGTGWMLLKRQREPLWILLVAAIIQIACLTFVAMMFVRH